MNNIIKIITLGFLCILPYISEAAYYYRWTDSKGVVHYANSIPPDDAQGGHVELNKSGMKKKVVISSKRKKQLKEEEKKLRIKKRIEAKIKKEKARQEEEEIRLLSIYSSEEEVTKAYNSKLRMAQLTIDLLKARHKKQSDKVEALENRKERLKNIKHAQLLDKQIEVALDNLSIYQQAITENLIEQDRVRKEFKATLAHFLQISAKQSLKEKAQ